MAYAKSSKDYKLVDNDADLRRSLRQLNRLEPNAFLAVDCEGVNLSRDGKLTIVTVATEEKVYIFDVKALGHMVFDQGLREILEDSTREKLMFDCRGDSDALWHQYRVKLSGVIDVQLLEIMYRRRPRFSSRAQRPFDADRIRGFANCLQIYVKEKQAVKIKERGKSLMQKDYKIWQRRPLSETMLRYCAVDTLQIFELFFHLIQSWKQSEQEIPGLRIASERYADFYRSKATRSYDEYESNAFLPVEIIPAKGEVYLTCKGCRRSLPEREFPRKAQKCSVCRKIDQKKSKDNKHNRGNMDDEDEDYGCYGDNDGRVFYEDGRVCDDYDDDYTDSDDCFGVSYDDYYDDDYDDDRYDDYDDYYFDCKW